MALPDVVFHITAMFACSFVFEALREEKSITELFETTGFGETIVSALGSPKREVRDACGQALGAFGKHGGAILAELGPGVDSDTWEYREGLAMALGYTLASLPNDCPLFPQLLASLATLLGLKSTDTNALSGNGSVVVYASRACGFAIRSGKDLGAECSQLLIANLGHQAIEVRRETAISVGASRDLLQQTIQGLEEGRPTLPQIHGIAYAFRVALERCMSREEKHTFISSFASAALKAHLRAAMTGDHSYAAAESIRVLSAMHLKVNKDLITMIRDALLSQDPLTVDAGLLSLRAILMDGSTRNEVPEDLKIWVIALQNHPAMAIQLVAADIVRAFSSDFSSFEPVQRMISFLRTALPMLEETTSPDQREVILRTAADLMRDVTLSSSEGARDIIQKMIKYVSEKMLSGFEDETLDFARGAAADLLEHIIRLCGEGGIMLGLSELEPALLVGLGTSSGAPGALRSIGQLARTRPESITSKMLFAAFLGVGSVLEKTKISALSILPALSRTPAVNGTGSEVWADAIAMLSDVCRGDTTPLDGLAAEHESYDIIPPTPASAALSLSAALLLAPGDTKNTRGALVSLVAAALVNEDGDAAEDTVLPVAAAACAKFFTRRPATPLDRQAALILGVMLLKESEGVPELPLDGETAGPELLRVIQTSLDIQDPGGDLDDILTEDTDIQTLSSQQRAGVILSRLGQHQEAGEVFFPENDAWAVAMVAAGFPTGDTATPAEENGDISFSNRKIRDIITGGSTDKTLITRIIAFLLDENQDEVHGRKVLPLLVLRAKKDDSLLRMPSTKDVKENEGFAADSHFEAMK